MELANKFSKHEKLKNKKAIDLLFSQGISIHNSPIKIVYIQKKEPSKTLINIGVSVPKKNIKLAVKRNLLKRRIREAYRLNNNELKTFLKNTGMEINLMFIYTSKQISSYKEIEDKIKVILTRLIKQCEVADQ